MALLSKFPVFIAALATTVLISGPAVWAQKSSADPALVMAAQKAFKAIADGDVDALQPLLEKKYAKKLTAEELRPTQIGPKVTVAYDSKVKVLRASDKDAVGPRLGDGDIGAVGGDIGVEVDATLELVQELAGYVVNIDEALCAWVLRYDGCAVCCYLGDAEWEVKEYVEGIFIERTEVGARHIGRAFDQVARYERTSQGVVVAVIPVVPVPRGTNYRRRICNTAANDDVGTKAQACNNGPGPEIGVRGHDRLPLCVEEGSGVLGQCDRWVF